MRERKTFLENDVPFPLDCSIFHNNITIRLLGVFDLESQS